MAFKEISIDTLKINPFHKDFQRMDADHGR